jgi:hypothetical protein
MCQCSVSAGLVRMALSSTGTTFAAQQHIAGEFGQHLGINGSKLKKPENHGEKVLSN